MKKEMLTLLTIAMAALSISWNIQSQSTKSEEIPTGPFIIGTRICPIIPCPANQETKMVDGKCTCVVKDGTPCFLPCPLTKRPIMVDGDCVCVTKCVMTATGWSCPKNYSPGIAKDGSCTCIKKRLSRKQVRS